MKLATILLSLVIFSFIRNTECGRAKNGAEFKFKLKKALKHSIYDENALDVDEYSDFVANHPNKLNKYDADNIDELKERYKLYKDTKKKIKKWNANAKKTIDHGRVFQESFGITIFADMTDEEKYNMFLHNTDDIDDKNNRPLIRRLQTDSVASCDSAASNKYDAIDPSILDTTPNSEYCTAIKNQGQTGGCWAFSTIGQAECNVNMQYNMKFASFSEQHLIDCTSPTQGSKKDGGWPTLATKYMSHYGFCSSNNYAYDYLEDLTRDEDGYCQCAAPKKFTSKCEIFEYGKDSDKLMKAAATGHAWTVDLLVSDEFMNLKGAFSTLFSCEPTRDANGEFGGHAVTLIGNFHGDYIRIKNSWGEGWGVNGYAHLHKDVLTGPCGNIGKLSRSYDFRL